MVGSFSGRSEVNSYALINFYLEVRMISRPDNFYPVKQLFSDHLIIYMVDCQYLFFYSLDVYIIRMNTCPRLWQTPV